MTRCRVAAPSRRGSDARPHRWAQAYLKKGRRKSLGFRLRQILTNIAKLLRSFDQRTLAALLFFRRQAARAANSDAFLALRLPADRSLQGPASPLLMNPRIASGLEGPRHLAINPGIQFFQKRGQYSNADQLSLARRFRATAPSFASTLRLRHGLKITQNSRAAKVLDTPEQP